MFDFFSGWFLVHVFFSRRDACLKLELKRLKMSFVTKAGSWQWLHAGSMNRKVPSTPNDDEDLFGINS